MRIIPFFGEFLIIFALLISLVLAFRNEKVNVTFLGATIGFFMEMYRIQLDYLQEILKFFMLGILVLIFAIVKKRG